MPKAAPRPADPLAAPLRRSLPLATKLLFGAPGFAGAAMVIPIGIHMTKFYADTVLVPLGVLGVAIAFARAFDAITDPLVGWLSDRTRTRLGRRRPWLLAGGPLCGFAFWLLFSPPTDLDPAGGAAWFMACYLLYFLFHTFYLIPHQALGAEISLDYHERSDLFAIREAFVVAGTLFAAVLPSVLTERVGERQALSTFAAIFGTLLGLLYLLLAVRVRERAEFSLRPDNPFVPGVRRSLRNRPFRILLANALFTGIPGALTATLLPFFNQYVVQPDNEPRWRMFLLAGYFGSAFLFLPLWIVVSRRLGKRRAMLLSQTIAAVGALTVLGVGRGDSWLLLGLLVLNGSAFGAFSFLTPAMKADVIDHDELHTGRRREAQYTALWAILPKFVQIPAAAIPIALLGTLGYVPNQPQPEAVLSALRWMFGLTPALCFLGGFLMTWRFPIERETHRRILDGIEAHARGEPAHDPVTGHRLPPPGEEPVDDETGWYLDHFSRSELQRVTAIGPRRLRYRIAGWAVLSLGLCLATGLPLFATAHELAWKPGVGTVLAVMVSGLSLCACLFHLLRLRAARGFEARKIAPETLAAHRNASKSSKTRR
jgi:GPH family glycoside/pentoside/hexuronide:cation symporter